jgi:hypothetical protein
MMDRAEPPSRPGVNTINDRTAVPSSSGSISRGDQIVVRLWKDSAGRIHRFPRTHDESSGADQVFGAPVELVKPTQGEHSAQARLAEQRRLACMRAHPSNRPQRYLREVLPQRDAG